MPNGFDLPKSFCVEKEGKRIFIFKEGYKDLVCGRATPGSGSTDRCLEERGTAHRTHTATWTVAPPGVLTVSPKEPKEVSIPGETDKKTVKGRGEYPCVPLEGGGTVIIRRVRHGGLWGKVMGDVLWGMGRPVQELINTNKALERGVPTAEILGVRLERLIDPIFGFVLPLYRAEVISRELTGTIDLIELLSQNTPLTQSMLEVRHVLGGDSKRREIIRTVAIAVRAMHEGGLYHNDLHLKNILVSGEAPFKAYIIDLDKSSLHESLSPNQRIENLLRLDRSVEKFIVVGAYRNTPLLITRRDKLRFLRDYMEGNPGWKKLARELHPRHTFHRWWWRVLCVMGIDTYGLRRNRKL